MAVASILGPDGRPIRASTDGGPFGISDHLWREGWQGRSPGAGGSPTSADKALTYSAVWRAVSLISEMIAGLPAGVFQREGKTRTRLDTHGLDKTLTRAANPEVGARTWRELALKDSLQWGNHYSRIEGEGGNQGVTLTRYEPWTITVARDDDGNLIYEYRASGTVEPEIIDPLEMFHLQALTANGFVGISPLGVASASNSLSLQLESFGSSFFSDGTTPGLVVTPAKNMDKDARELLKASINERHQDKPHRAMVLPLGVEVQTFNIPLEHAQFLESRTFQIDEVARWFGLPPHMLAELSNAHFDNIESQRIEFVENGLMPWIQRFEEEAALKLLQNEPSNVKVKLNVKGLLRADTAARTAFYRVMTDIGSMSPNDVRALEDVNPIEEGDVYTIAANRQLLEDVGKEPAPAALPAPAFNRAEAIQGQHGLFVAAVNRWLIKERRAVTRAAKKAADLEEFRAWADTFFAHRADEYAEAITPAADALLAIVAQDAHESVIGAAYSEVIGVCERSAPEAFQAYVEAHGINGLEGVTTLADDRVARLPQAVADELIRLICETTGGDDAEHAHG